MQFNDTGGFMKLLIISIALISSSITFAGTFIENGQCGPFKISFRVIGSSGVSAKEAVNDSRKVARIECAKVCLNQPGSSRSYCGIHNVGIDQSIYLAEVDYLCTCPF